MESYFLTTSPRAQWNVYVGGERGGGGGARLRRKEQTSAGAQGKMRCELQGHTTGSTTRRTECTTGEQRRRARGRKWSSAAWPRITFLHNHPRRRVGDVGSQTDRQTDTRTQERHRGGSVPVFGSASGGSSRFKRHQQLHPAKGGGQWLCGFPASARLLSRFLPQAKDVHVTLTGYSKLSPGVSVKVWITLRWTGHSSRDASHLQPRDIWDGLQQQQDLGEVKEQRHRPRMDEWTATFGSCSNKSAVHPTIGTKWRQENWLPDKFQPPACCLPEAPTHFSRVVRLTLDARARWSHPEGTTCRGGARPSIIPTAFAEVVNTSQALLWVTTTSQPYVAVTHVSRKSLMAANAPDDAVEPSHDAKKSSRASSTLLISEFSPKHLCSEPTETVSGSIKYVWGRLLNIIFCDLKEG